MDTIILNHHSYFIVYFMLSNMIAVKQLKIKKRCHFVRNTKYRKSIKLAKPVTAYTLRGDAPIPFYCPHSFPFVFSSHVLIKYIHIYLYIYKRLWGMHSKLGEFIHSDTVFWLCAVKRCNNSHEVGIGKLPYLLLFKILNLISAYKLSLYLFINKYNFIIIKIF